MENLKKYWKGTLVVVLLFAFVITMLIWKDRKLDDLHHQMVLLDQREQEAEELRHQLESLGTKIHEKAESEEQKAYSMERVAVREFDMASFSGYVLVGRATCEYCAVVHDYMLSLTYDRPTVYISLEEEYMGPNYIGYKEQLGVEFVPVLQEYVNGEKIKETDELLDIDYPDLTDYDARVESYNRMKAQIDEFMNGDEL